MRTPGELPDELGETFSVRAAVGLGVSKSRLRTSDIQTPFRGARSILTPDPTEHFLRMRHQLILRCRAYAAVAPQGFAFSHITASRLFRMPIPTRLERVQSLDVSYLHVHVRRAGVIGHRVKNVTVRYIDGLPVVSPELAWIQLAPLLGVDELVVAGDHLVRRKLPVSSMHSIRSAMIAHTGARGMKTARAAYDRIRPRTDSPKESEVRLIIVNGGLPEPVINFEVTNNGEWVGTPDLAYPELRIAIEYQGSHHRDEDVFDDDIIRRELFVAAGWTVILITKSQLARPQHIVARIRQAIELARG